MLSGNIVTSGTTVTNYYTDYNIKEGKFIEWLAQRPKMGIVKVIWGSGDTTISNAGMNVSGLFERAMNMTTVDAVNVMTTDANMAPYRWVYDPLTRKLVPYGLLSGASTATQAMVAVESGQLALNSAILYCQVFGT